MKKTIITFVILSASFFTLKAQEVKKNSSYFYAAGFKKEIVTIYGMEYLFVYAGDNSFHPAYAIYSINLTKEKLEVELLKKQLEEKKKPVKK